MSSAISTDTASTAEAVPSGSGAHAVPPDDKALKPWQFFLLAGMLAATAAVLVATGQSMASIITLSLTVVAASLAGLGTYRTLVPFVGPAAILSPDAPAGRARAAIEREKTLVLRAIKDLEFDRGMGKIDQADFDEMSARLRRRAVGLIQQLEGGVAHRDRIERELAERLAKGGAGKTKPAPPPSVATCPSCGTSNDPDARFCKECGTKLEAAR